MEQSPARLRITFNAPVVLVFVGLCFAATLAGQLTGGAATITLFSTYAAPLTSPLTYVRLLTHVLGHSSWEHLISNMLYILMLGPLLEEKYGSTILAEVILITALVTGVINNLLFPSSPLCGASGICFAFILLSSLTSFGEGEVPLTFILVALLFLGQEVLQGVFVRDNISNLTHILGGLMGAGLGFALRSTSKERR